MYRLRVTTFILGLLLVSCSGAAMLESATASASETQGVVVTGTPSVTLSNFAGAVTVRDGEADRVVANLTKLSHHPDADQAQADVNGINMSISQANNDVDIRIEGPREGDSLSLGAMAEVELLVPPGSEVALTLGSGAIEVVEPSGDIQVELGEGNVTFRMPADASFTVDIAGGEAKLESDFAEVTEEGLADSTVAVVGSDPAVTLFLRLGSGSIRLLEVR